MAFEAKNKASFADVISYCNETKSERGYSPSSNQHDLNVETISLRSKSPQSCKSEKAWSSPIHKEALELSSRKRRAVLNMIEKNWKLNIRSKIESDLTDQVQQALDPLSSEKRWSDQKKAERQKKLRMFKVNTYNRSKFSSRLAADGGGGGGGDFKYIDVNYIPQHRVLPGREGFYSKESLPRTLANLRLPRKTGLPSQAIYGLEDMARAQKHASNMRGGLDVTLLDSNFNFLSLPKHENNLNGLRPLDPNVITYNGLSLPNYGANRRCFQMYTKEGMNNLLSSRTRRGKLTHLGDGKYVDKRGVTISRLGPFWPQGYGPVCECPKFIPACPKQEKLLPVLDQSASSGDIPTAVSIVPTSSNNAWLTKGRPVNLTGEKDIHHSGTNTTRTQQPNPAFANHQSKNQPVVNHKANDRLTSYQQSSANNYSLNHSNTNNQSINHLQSPRNHLPNHQPVVTSNQTSNTFSSNRPNNQTANQFSNYPVTGNHTSNAKPSNYQSTNHKSNHVSPRDPPLNKVTTNQSQSRAPQGGGKPVWRGKPVIYDCDRSSRSPLPHCIPEGMDESLVFESRFESGNLRQVRRISEFEYELVLRTDMYTNRHTQWYYFRMQKAKRNRTYKFNIINFLKKDSLYNYGMKPLIYSAKRADNEEMGWHRIGQNIKYAAWTNPTRNAILSLDLQYYCLEFELSLDWNDVEEDTLYLAHCYPYTYSDLRRHLDHVMENPEMARHVKKEVLCETTAGNACFLLTITEFPDPEKDKYKDFHQEKKGVVITARVHPGESQSSWMMKGVIEHLTSDHPLAKQLRQKFVFKIVPMLNPDGVIVGNYRTSLAARDLNRNYRHPKQGTFPTIWHTKQMVDQFNKDHPIILYCDLHGHSRKHMVFMYGCERKAINNLNAKNKKNSQSGDGNNRTDNSSPPKPISNTQNGGNNSLDETRDFVEERMFPWLMHQLAPTRFSFHGTKFAVRRSKESTGRVVMFRQMGIWNSFTMEASFSGTNMEKENGRHFNIDDFQLIGRKLCDCVLEYSKVCESPLAKSRAIMEMTRDIAQQLLQSRKKAAADAAKAAANDSIAGNADNVSSKKSPQSKTNTSMNGTCPSYPTPNFANIKSTIARQLRRNPSRVPTNPEAEPQRPPANKVSSEQSPSNDKPSQKPAYKGKKSPPAGTNTFNGDDVTMTEDIEPVTQETESEESADVDCYRLLQSLNVHQVGLESETSSESNSDSEPELPVESPSSSEKHRGSQRNSGGNRKKKKKKKQGKNAKSISAPSNMQPGQSSSKKILEEPTIKEAKGKNVTTSYPGYVNKYANRSNGGIPIFAQERMKERAARRLAELKLAEEDRRQQENQLREQLLLAGIQDGPNVTYEMSHDEQDDGYSEICGVRYKVANQSRKVHYMVYNPYRGQSPTSGQDRRPVVTMRFSPPSQLRPNQMNNASQLPHNKQPGGELYMPYRVQAAAGRLSNQRGLSSLTEFSGSISGGSPTEPSSSQSSDRVADDQVDDLMFEHDPQQSDDRIEPRSVVVPLQKYNVSFKMYKQPWKQKAAVTSQRRHPDVDELDLVAMQQENSADELPKVPPEQANGSELLLPPSMDVAEVMTAHMRYPGQVHRVEAMRPLPRGRTMSRGPPMIFGEPVTINQKSHESLESLEGLNRQKSFTKSTSFVQQKNMYNENRLRNRDAIYDEIISHPFANDSHNVNIEPQSTSENPVKTKLHQSASDPLFVPRFVALAPPRGANTEESEKGNLTDRTENNMKEASGLQPSTVR